MIFSNNEISLILEKEVPANPEKGWLRALHFKIQDNKSNRLAGNIDLRIGYTDSVVRFGGHIGYGIYEEFRGNHYAGKACLLLKEEIIKHGMDVIWITCNPDNYGSRKTCEYVGAKLVEIVDLPEDNDMYLEGERQKCRYRWIVY